MEELKNESIENKSNQKFAKYHFYLAFLLTGSVIAVLPLNGGQGEVTLTQTPNPYLHLDPISRNISITKELDTDKDDNGNQMMSDIILQVMCMPTGSTRKVRNICMKSEKWEKCIYLRDRSDFSISVSFNPELKYRYFISFQ